MQLEAPPFKLLIVDDDAVLAAAFSTVSQEYLDGAQISGEVLPCAYTLGILIHKKILGLHPTDVLLDVRLGGGNTATTERLLANLSKDSASPRVWLMSAYEARETHDRLFKKYPEIVQANWFAKPLWLDEVLKPIIVAARSSNSSEINQSELDESINAYFDLPLPVRAFNLSGKIRVNKAWTTAPNQPPLKPFLEAIGRAKTSIPPDWWLSPFNGDLEYLEWRLIESSADTWLQLPRNRQQPDAKTIQDIAKLTAGVMARGGFPRGRIYTLESVPNSKRVDHADRLCADTRETAGAYLRLRYYCNRGILRDARDEDHPEGKMVHPLYGQLADRLDQFLNEFPQSLPANHLKNPLKLVYRIRRRGEDDVLDEGIRYWNKGVPDYRALDSWLEVPLLSFLDSKKTPTMVGILVFDRLGSEEVGDAPAASVTEGLVHTLESTLLKLCHLWREWRRAWVEQEELNWHRDLVEAQSRWGKMASSTLRQVSRRAGESLEQAIVDLAVECVQATSGILATLPLGSLSLRIPAWGGDRTASPDLPPLFLPLKNERFLSCRVFNDNDQKPLHMVDYRTEPKAKRLYADDWRDAGASPEQVSILAKWTSELASVIAVPIVYGGETIAVLTLHKDQPFHFTTLRVLKVRLLAERVAWMLGVVREVQHRHRWENLLLHNIRKFPLIYVGESRALRNALAPLRSNVSISLDRLDLATKQIMHIVEGYRCLIAGGHSDSSGVKVSAGEASRELLRLFEEDVQARHLKLPNLDSLAGNAWDISLSEPFELVWYNLLNNAISYAQYEGRVELKAESNQHSWFGEVWNSASDNSILDLKGVWNREDGQERPIPKLGTGMGIGLRASRSVCAHLGANLDMAPEARNGILGVRLALSWPLVSHTKE